jgi:UDP-galactopyranose mutase
MLRAVNAARRDAYDVLVVGAGFAGATMAERAASQLDLRVLVVDRRPYVGGNAHDHVDESGLRVHMHGPHLFHTNAAHVVEYLSQFTEWRPYEHRVLACVNGQLVPLPINLDTVNRLYGLDLDSDDMEHWLARRAEAVEMVRTGEDAVVARVGRDLYEKFFRGYTRKLWARDPSELAASVTARIPTRTDRDDRYFTDEHQALPSDGYTAMFERMLDHPLIDVALSTSFADVRDALQWGHLVWTGPIDDFYDRRFGALPYRSLSFEWETVATPGGSLLQPVAQLNYPDEAVTHTRLVEHRHFTGERAEVTRISREYPTDEGEPFYPVPAPQHRELYHRYAELAEQDPAVTFVGRLARYQYLNMDQVTAQALVTFERIRERLPTREAA